MNGLDEITNSAQVIDSREIIDRIAWLESVARDGDIDEDEAAELGALRELAGEAENCAGDWIHGATLIRDSYFTDYAQDLAEDVCGMGCDQPWPWCHVDWTAAADALKQDYSCVDFDGVTYWVRS